MEVFVRALSMAAQCGGGAPTAFTVCRGIWRAPLMHGALASASVRRRSSSPPAAVSEVLSASPGKGDIVRWLFETVSPQDYCALRILVTGQCPPMLAAHSARRGRELRFCDKCSRRRRAADRRRSPDARPIARRRGSSACDERDAHRFGSLRSELRAAGAQPHDVRRGRLIGPGDHSCGDAAELGEVQGLPQHDEVRSDVTRVRVEPGDQKDRQLGLALADQSWRALHRRCCPP